MRWKHSTFYLDIGEKEFPTRSFTSATEVVRWRWDTPVAGIIADECRLQGCPPKKLELLYKCEDRYEYIEFAAYHRYHIRVMTKKAASPYLPEALMAH
jgi:hypothetical protein